MTSDDTALAVTLRQAQWLLDDTARNLPAGQLSAAQADELAAILDDLAALVRRRGARMVVDGEHDPGESPRVIDAAP